MLNNEFPPLGGGTGTVNQALLERFALERFGGVEGLEIDLVTSALGKEFETQQFAERIRIYKVPVDNRNIHHSSNRELLRYARRSLRLALKLQRAKPYDFCFAWSAVPAGGVALALHRLAGLPYLVRVCGPDIPGFERRYRWLYPFLTPAIRRIWHGAETVVAKCGGEAEMILDIDREVRITLVPNGVEEKAFPVAPPIPDEGPLRVLCVGRLIERKGQHHLIEAVKQLSDEGIAVELELVGTGDALAADQALARRLGVAKRVHFSGYIPREQIARHYATAHVFALPSYNEGMSVATMEAMAAGLPVILTRTGGTAELVQEGVNGFIFTWGEVEALAAHLRCLAVDRPLARKMGAASHALALAYTWEAAADFYLDLFRWMAPGLPLPSAAVPLQKGTA